MKQAQRMSRVDLKACLPYGSIRPNATASKRQPFLFDTNHKPRGIPLIARPDAAFARATAQCCRWVAQNPIASRLHPL